MSGKHRHGHFGEPKMDGKHRKRGFLLLKKALPHRKRKFWPLKVPLALKLLKNTTLETETTNKRRLASWLATKSPNPTIP